jgi:hypothetical protein
MLKRLAVAAVALAWLAAWLQPCACPSPAEAHADHGCCVPAPGLREAAVCCSPASAPPPETVSLASAAPPPFGGLLAAPPTATPDVACLVRTVPAHSPLRPVLRI